MRILTGLGCAAFAIALIAVTSAGAEEEGEGHMRLPVSYVERGITNPQGILSPGIELDIERSPPPPIPGASAQLGVALAINAGYAITDDFGVRATVAVLNLTNPFYFAGAGGGVTYRAVKGEFELGIALDGAAAVPPPNSMGPTIGVMAPSVPMHVHFGKRARLDVTPTVPLVFGGSAVGVDFALPVAFAVDIIEPLHVGVSSGVSMVLNPCAGAVGGGCTANVGQTLTIPVGFFGGYAIAGRQGPILDIDPFFTWNQLFVPGAPAPEPTTYSGNYTIGLELTGYIYL